MNLTYKNKKLSFDDKEAIEDLKSEMIREAHNRCTVCDKPFNVDRLPQISHRIQKGKRTYRKLGYEVVNHRLNLQITCDTCNSSVLISEETLQGKELVNRILAELNS